MQYADPSLDWTGWLEENKDEDDATKLAALREYIAALGEEWAGRERITVEWVNKKLTTLGITELVQREVPYTLRALVSAEMDMVVYARNRTEAMEKANERLNGGGSAAVTKVAGTGTVPAFIGGPEDPDPQVIADAPQTVDALLAALREVIMLGHIAGPKFCKDSADSVLDDFGLAPIPDRKRFTVERAVEGVMTTTVEAYDEVSAQRVAGWRWDSQQSGFALKSVTNAPDSTVVVSAAN